MTEQEPIQHPAEGSAESMETSVENTTITESPTPEVPAEAAPETAAMETAPENTEVAPEPEAPVMEAESPAAEDSANALPEVVEESAMGAPEAEAATETAAPMEIVAEPQMTMPETETTVAEVAAEPEATVMETVAEAPMESVAPAATESAAAEAIAAPSEEDKQSAEEKAAAKAAEAERRRQYKEMLDGLFAELEQIHAAGETVEVTVKERIKGGLRVQYKDLRLFLPASHFSLKRTPTEQEMQNATGTTIPVHINEIQQDEQGRKTVVVSRRKVLTSSFFSTINEGDVVEGKVVSMAPFGVFVDLNGIEGLIHISRLSSARVEDPSQVVKKGEIIKAKVIAVDKNTERISLSRREFEESPWVRAEQDFPVGNLVKGVVKRVTDFGAYVALKPGIEGLLRNSELSWGRRVQHPSEVVTPGQELELMVLSVSAESKRIALGLKQTKANPWETIVENLPVGTITNATVRQSSANGLVVRLNEDFDGFIPRSKIRNIGGKVRNYNPDETLEVTVVDINPETFSLILAPKYDEAELAMEAASHEERPRRDDRAPRQDNRAPRQDDRGPRRDDRGPRRDDRGPRRNDREKPTDNTPQQDVSPSFTFFDLLSEEEKQGLQGGN